MSRSAPKLSRPAVSRGEFLKAVAALSKADLAWLDRTADLLAAAISGWCGQDLLRAATERTLSGSRNCPVHIGVIVHLGRTMRSIAYNERRKARGGEAAWSEMERRRDVDNNPHARLERDEAERALRGRVADAFAHHPNARRVALAVLDGYTGAHLREITGLDEVAYASARKAMRRELERYLNGDRT